MKKSKIVGWVLSVLLVLFLIVASAGGKFADWPGKEEMLKSMGFTSELLFKIGILEVVISLIFLVPRAGFIGAILLTAYLGGATVTHVRVGEPFFFPVLFGVITWVCLGLRQPEVFRLALGMKSKDDVNSAGVDGTLSARPSLSNAIGNPYATGE